MKRCRISKTAESCGGRERYTSEGRIITWSGRRWKGVVIRCNPQGSYQRVRPTYVGVTNNFGSFQQFTEWARNQTGYGIPSWQLDKDIICPGNNTYSVETCCFVPSEVNSFLCSCAAARGSLPVGVFKASASSYQARCRIGGAYVRLGSYPTASEAFAAYKVAKEGAAKDLARKWRGQIDPRAYAALMQYTVEITD